MSGGAASSLKPTSRVLVRVQSSTADWTVLWLAPTSWSWMLAKTLPDGECITEDEPTSRNLKKGLLSVANDETGHAAYLYEAMMRRMSAADVQKLVDEWRTRKVNALLAMVGSLLQRSGKTPSLVQMVSGRKSPMDGASASDLVAASC